MTGYALVQSTDPRGKNGLYYEHILVMEEFIGRKLKPFETVHHINEIKIDNRIENLFLCTRLEHDKAHGMRTVSQYKIHDHWISKNCKVCGRVFYGDPKKIRDRVRCSRWCKRIRVTIMCNFCEKNIIIPRQLIDKWLYCSKRCKRLHKISNIKNI